MSLGAGLVRPWLGWGDRSGVRRVWGPWGWGQNVGVGLGRMGAGLGSPGDGDGGGSG